jgi:F-type H+-transporting ATPase subunit delta
LTKIYGRELRLNLEIDPSIIGGLRVQVGDDVIDGSISSRINDLRLQLAG